MELWHGGVVNIGTALTYSLSPLIFIRFYQIILFTCSYKNVISLAIIIALASSTFWMLSPLVLLVAVITIPLLYYSNQPLIINLKKLFIFTSFVLLLNAYEMYAIIFEFINKGIEVSSDAAPVFGNMQGGILYQLLFLHSWGIYTVWHPRTLYPFGDYFFSAQYFTGIGLFYLFSTYLFFKANKNKFFFILLVALFISIFLSKGAQAPLGDLFLYLYKNLPGFTVFRTPDIRFGFTTQVCYFILFSLSIHKIKLKAFAILSISLILISFPLFNGNAINGQNIPMQYSDRKFNFTKDEIALQNYINDVNQDKSAYFITYPSLVYGKFNRDFDKFYVGPDPLSKILDINSAYLSSHSGMQNNTVPSFKLIYSNYHALNNFPIKYIIVRSDTDLNMDFKIIKYFSDNLKLVFKNNTYMVYHNPNYSGLLYANDVSSFTHSITDFSFKSKYILDNIKFNLQYSNNFKLIFDDNCDFNSISKYRYFESILNYFINYKSQFLYTHSPSSNNLNNWILNDNFKKNKANCFYYSIIFIPQLIYFSLLLLSSITSLMLLFLFKKNCLNKIIT
jgi:hypothetical protein